MGTVLGPNPLASVDWDWSAKLPGPTSLLHHVGIEVLNVRGWLTHGDFALEVGVDFLAIFEHRLMPAWVRSEWARLRVKGLASIWAPACQIPPTGFGVISINGAPLALPTFATAQFRVFF